jgi:hypothetical protein
VQRRLQRFDEVLGIEKGEKAINSRHKIFKLTKSFSSKISLGNSRTHAQFDDIKTPAVFEDMSPAAEWNELAKKICKRNDEYKIDNQEVLDELEEEDEDYDDGEDEEDDDENDSDEDTEMVPPKVKVPTTKKPIPSTKAPKEKTTAKPKATTSVPPSVVDSDNENDESEADDDYDSNEERDYDEEVEDESITTEKPDQSKTKNVLLNTIKVIQDFDNRIFGESNGFSRSAQNLIEPSNILGGEDENVTVEVAGSDYRFLWPIIIVMLSIVVVLLVIMNVIAICMRRRGERYRQALLQSKNSIIYQKLSEEIAPQTPKVHRYIIIGEKAVPQTPKAHRYTPIEQV